jgi:hypothetical protein
MARTAVGGVLFFAIGVMAGVWVAQAQAPDWDPSRTVIPGVRCLDAHQDLGLVWQTDALEVAFHLVNDSPDETFKIGPIRGGCSCTRVSPDSLTLTPGESSIIQATIDLETMRIPAGREAPFEESISALVEDPWGEGQILRMTVLGSVRPSYLVDPPHLSLGPMARGAAQPACVSVRSLLPHELSTLDIITESERLRVTTGEPFAQASRWLLGVAIPNDAPAGRLRERVRFRAGDSAGSGVTGSFLVVGRIVEDVCPVPSVVALGAVPLGSTSTAEMRLVSHAGQTFSVEAVRPGSSAVRIRRLGQRLGAAFEVMFLARESGHATIPVRFDIKTDDGGRFATQLEVVAYVTAVSLDP